ncbi:MAG: hypothetical protein ACXVLQ_16735 [Bacteriovorax sp.]
MKTKTITTLFGIIIQATSAMASVVCDYQQTPCDAYGDHYLCTRQIFANLPSFCSRTDLTHTAQECRHNMNVPCKMTTDLNNGCQSDSDCNEGQQCEIIMGQGVCSPATN